MPCSSEHMKQTGTEAYRQRVARLLVYVIEKTEPPASKADVGELKSFKQAADDPYCPIDYTDKLCAKIKGLRPGELDAVVYNARDPMSRKLADWWEEHQDADVKREAQQVKIARWSEHLRDQPITFAMITDGIHKIRDEFGVDYAKGLIKDFGQVQKVMDIPGNRYHWVYAAIQVSLGEVS